MERSVKDLSGYRFECCKEALEDARVMYETGRYKNALNRAYYSIFYAMRSVCALDELHTAFGRNALYFH